MLSSSDAAAHRLSAQAAAAWDASFLTSLPPAASQALLETATEIEAQPGQGVRRELVASRSLLVLVTSGLVRVYAQSPHGREVTVRYARRGDVAGVVTAFTDESRHGMQAVTRAGLVVLHAGTLRRLARTDGQVAWTLCNVLQGLIVEVVDRLSSNVFQSVTERVAAALLELGREADGQLIAQASQQQLADSIGSVREVVARSLRQLDDAGLVRREGSGIVLADSEGLRRLSAYGESTDMSG